MKRTSILAVVVGVLLLFGAISLYQFSGLPWPFADDSRFTEERFGRQAAAVAGVIKAMDPKSGVSVTVDEVDTKARELGCEGEIGDVFNRGLLSSSRVPLQLGDVLFLHDKPDPDGFTVAVTSTGMIVKIQQAEGER